MVDIFSRYESAFLSAYLGENGHRSWIGLKVKKSTIGEGSYTSEWTNGEPVEFTNWGAYEPGM